MIGVFINKIDWPYEVDGSCNIDDQFIKNCGNCNEAIPNGVFAYILNSYGNSYDIVIVVSEH